MKILDKYLLKTFLITFTTVFVILFFIFILQTVWLFISELAGKDLDFLLVVKFLLFSMPRIVPLVLPLSVLLASIMTFGSLSENYEFAAMKSSGISFRRAMHSITIFIILLSVLSFFFANNVIPYAEYKFINFRRNIAQVKPAMAIAEGQFSEVGNYTIKVEKKSGEKGNFLTGVTIHKKSELGEGNTTVIKAKKGELVSSENSNTLKLVLTDGTYYEDIIPRRYEERRRVPFAKGTFKRDVINIDLSKLNQNNMNSVDISNTNTMLNIREIRFTLDSLNKNFKKDMRSYADNIYLRTGISNTTYKSPKTINPTTFDVNDILKGIDLPRKEQILKIAESNVENTGFTIDSAVFEMLAKEKNINSHWIALYDKFMIAFSCLLMFFIGAPLGAIIRKGGLGLPIVFAVSIFIVFHFINTFGKRVAQENEMSAFLGVWMSSLLLTPLAILLTYRAINDIGGMISFDGFLLPFQKLFPAKKIKSENPTPAIINLDHVTMDSDDEWQTLTTYTDTQLIGIVKNAVQFNYSNAYRTKALKILDQRGITQEQLQESNNLVNQEYQNIAKLVVDFHNESKTALYLYFVLTGITIGVTQYKSVLFLLLSVVLFVILSFRIYKSQKILDEIGTLVGKKIEPGTEITLFLGFPFYLFIYFYNKKMLKEALNQFR